MGRSAKTLLALTIGQILGEEKSVLYLNMESYSGFENLFDLDNEKNLTDFFTSLGAGKILFMKNSKDL